MKKSTDLPLTFLNTHCSLTKKSRENLAGTLHPVLVDLLELSLQTKQAHWNLQGPEFQQLHEKLDELHAFFQDTADEVAERLLAVGVTVDGRAASVAQHTSLGPFPAGPVSCAETRKLMIARMAQLAKNAREAAARAGEDDPVSEDMLIGFVSALEKRLWMLEAHLR